MLKRILFIVLLLTAPVSTLFAQTISAPSVSQWEGDVNSTITVTISLDAVATHPVSLNYSVIDPGNTTSVYGAYFTPTSGTLMIPAGQIKASVQIAYVGDKIPQGARTFAIAWSNPVGAALNTNGMPIVGYSVVFTPAFAINIQYGSLIMLIDDDGKPVANNPVTVVIPTQAVTQATFVSPNAPYGVYSLTNSLTLADPINTVWFRCKIIPTGTNPAQRGLDYLDSNGDGTDGGTLNATFASGTTANPGNLLIRRGSNPTPGRQFLVQVYRGVYAYKPAQVSQVTIGD